MGFMSNLRESINYKLIKFLSKELQPYIDREMKKLEDLQKSIDYLKPDMLFLFQNGFNYNKEDDSFFKTEDIDYGKYPGKYLITINFPKRYPTKPPRIYFKPLHSNKISKHIMDNHEVCIAGRGSHELGTYWKKDLNIKAALKLAYQVATDAWGKPANKTRKSISIKGTIIEDLSKTVTIKKFIKGFAEPNFLNVDNTYTWEEIAVKTGKFNTGKKKKLIEFYNKEAKCNKLKQKKKKKQYSKK